MRLYNPWPEPYSINPRSPYGWRRHPITGKRKFHHGVDVALPVGTPLIAGADGVIAHKGSGASGGYTLLIRHAGNWHTVYYHLQKPSHLNVGDSITAGQVVASSGNTGRSTGPHLHYELRRSRAWGDTVDPVPYLQGPYRDVTSNVTRDISGDVPRDAASPVKRDPRTRPPRRLPRGVAGISGAFKAMDVRHVRNWFGRR